MDYTAPGETPWCATKVTSICFQLTSTNQVDGMGNFLHLAPGSTWGYCESNCPADTDSSATLACPHSVSQIDNMSWLRTSTVQEPAFPEECDARHSSTHKNILFLGNSYTDGAGGCEPVDFIVQKIAEGAGFSATTDRSSPGGKTLEWHATNSLDRIRNGDWDVVVLQDQSQRPSFGSGYVYNNILPDVRTLVQTMRETNVCTLPVFFQTWGKMDGDTGNCGPAPWDALCTFEGVQDQLTEAYNTMAYVAQPSKVAPAGEAWRTYPDRNSLFSIDGSHASCRGTFLAAATIFRVRKSWQSTIKAIILLNYEHCTYCLSLSKSGGCQPPPAPTNTNGSKMLQLWRSRWAMWSWTLSSFAQENIKNKNDPILFF